MISLCNGSIDCDQTPSDDPFILALVCCAPIAQRSHEGKGSSGLVRADLSRHRVLKHIHGRLKKLDMNMNMNFKINHARKHAEQIKSSQMNGRG